MPETEGEGGPAQARLRGDDEQQCAEAEAEGEERQSAGTKRHLATGAEQGLAADPQQGEGGPPGAALGERQQQAAMALEALGRVVADGVEAAQEPAEQANGQGADHGKAAAEQAEQRPKVGEAAQAGAQASMGGEGATAGERTDLAAEQGGPRGELTAEFTGPGGDLLAEGAQALERLRRDGAGGGRVPQAPGQAAQPQAGALELLDQPARVAASGGLGR